MVTTEAGRALDDPAYHLSSCWLNSPNRTNEGCDCGHSELLAAIEAEAAAAERERLMKRGNLYPVLVTPGLFEELADRVVWGEADEDGFYTPALYAILAEPSE